jgi:hypothetical protein
MPGDDRTGPMGFGPMTGRRLGLCCSARPDGWSSGGHKGFGAFGRGRGRGWRHWYYATGLPGWVRMGGGGRRASASYPPRSDQDELSYLKESTIGLEPQLNALRARMAELERAGKTE